MLRRESRLVRDGTPSVPRAHILTDVTAEYMVSDFRAMRSGKTTAELDGEIRNAESRVQSVDRTVGHERRGRAGVNAARACAAAVGRRRVRLNLDGNEQFTKEKPGAHLLVDEARVPADPAQTGIARIGPLEQRRGVDTNLV